VDTVIHGAMIPQEPFIYHKYAHAYAGFLSSGCFVVLSCTARCASESRMLPGQSLILRTFAVTIRCVGDVTHSVLKQRTVLCHGDLLIVGGGAAGERREAHTVAEGPAHAVPAGNIALSVRYL
jgi:hypothetical protein